MSTTSRGRQCSDRSRDLTSVIAVCRAIAGVALPLFIAHVLTTLLLCSCTGGFTDTDAPLSVDHMENRYFILDFEDDCTMSEVEKLFFLTFPHDDPTGGDVVYDRTRWVNADMVTLERKALNLYIRDRNDDAGFDSFRLTSKPYYNLNEEAKRILFVLKGAFPSAPGIWPAWWLNGGHEDTWNYRESEQVGSDESLDHYSGVGHFFDTPSAVNPTDWPAAGEIDIIETINGRNIIYNTIHTCPQMCDSEWNGDGDIVNCANATDGDPNSGCSGKGYSTNSPEGTFACLWERETIRFYYWTPEEDVRQDGAPLNQNPDPELWTGNLKNEVRLLETTAECKDGLHAEWQCKSCGNSSSCTLSNMKMILNTTLCGKWAGNEFDNTDDALINCREYIFGEGKGTIDGQFMRIEYIATRGL